MGRFKDTPRPAKNASVDRSRKNHINIEEPRQVKKTRKSKPGSKAVREIRKLQKTTDLIVKKAPFTRISKEILHDMKKDELKLSKDGVAVLQVCTSLVLSVARVSIVVIVKATLIAMCCGCCHIMILSVFLRVNHPILPLPI